MVDIGCPVKYILPGPSMYGYIVRKSDHYNRRRSYPFQESIEQHLRTKILDRCQNRKIEILEEQVDTCVFQLKELGYIQFSEKREKKGEVFRGITLTEAGERRLALLKTETKK